MAETSGLVQELLWGFANVDVRIGPDSGHLQQRTVFFSPTDSPATLAIKRNMVDVLAVAERAGFAVTVTHSAIDVIDAVQAHGWNITPHGPAVRGDLFSIAGTDFPADARLTFEKGGRTVEIEPLIARPHLAVIDELPVEVPPGANMVQVVGQGYASDRVPVAVIDGPSPKVRVIHAGPASDRPYTIALVASPAILRFDGVIGDTTATDPVLFSDMVALCLRQLFTLEEELLRADDIDRRMRIVAVRDPASVVSGQTALVEEGPGVVWPRLAQISSYLSGFDIRADVAIALSSSTQPSASAIPTLDNDQSPGVSYVLDGLNLVHRELAAAPGVIAIPSSELSDDSATVLHEFGHAASPRGLATCADLYIDNVGESYPINKHFREHAGDTIPERFGTLDNATWFSDLHRPAGYPSDWTSYHPKRRSALPNIMDRYSKDSLFDWITWAFLASRLRTKVQR